MTSADREQVKRYNVVQRWLGHDHAVLEREYVEHGDSVDASAFDAERAAHEQTKAKLREAEQYREWAEPQIVTHGEDQATIASQAAQIERLRKYAQHLHGCWWLQPHKNGDSCTCGLDAALSPARPDDEGERK